MLWNFHPPTTGDWWMVICEWWFVISFFNCLPINQFSNLSLIFLLGLTNLLSSFFCPLSSVFRHPSSVIRRLAKSGLLLLVGLAQKLGYHVGSSGIRHAVCWYPTVGRKWLPCHPDWGEAKRRDICPSTIGWTCAKVSKIEKFLRSEIYVITYIETNKKIFKNSNFWFWLSALLVEIYP